MQCPYERKAALEKSDAAGVLGKSSQTFTPQKWEPSVQMGVVMLARRWQGGPMRLANGGGLGELGDFVHAGGVDFFLGVEAGAHGPFVEEMEEGTGLDEADGFCVGEKVERDFGLDPASVSLFLADQASCTARS